MQPHFLKVSTHMRGGRFGGVGVAFSPRSQQMVGSSLSGALAALGRSLSVTISEISKARVCGALSVGHCT